jgi:hypothetical protein
MMDPRDARLVLREARSWHARGLLTAEALAAIEAEYAAAAAAPKEAAAADGLERPGLGLSILYALAGVLLGAACVAVPVLLHVAESWVGLWLLALGLPLLAVGLALWRGKAPAGIVDAVLIGSLVPLAFMGAPGDSLGKWLAPLGLVLSVAMTWLPRPSPTVPVVASVATYVCTGLLAHQWFREPDSFDEFADVGEWVWLLVTLAQLAATLLLGRRLGLSWRLPVSALLCIGAVVPFVLVLDTALPSHPTRFYELLVGAFELALLAIGLGLRERGLVLGAALVVAGDAIVFAFDLNVLLGIVVLLAVAAALVALATVLKRSRRPDAGPERT